MKIIRRGHTKPWWDGKQGECFYCKTIVELEEHDKVLEHDSQKDGTSVSIDCPICGKRGIIIWKKP